MIDRPNLSPQIDREGCVSTGYTWIKRNGKVVRGINRDPEEPILRKSEKNTRHI